MSKFEECERSGGRESGGKSTDLSSDITDIVYT